MILPRGGPPPIHLGLLITLLATLASGSHATPWPVTSTADAGPGSLRAALEQANSQPGDDRIEITVTGEIRLGAELPPVAGNTVLVGPGADLLRVVGSGKHRLLTFLPGTTNRLSGLTLTGGRLTNGAPGAGLRNQGSLELIDCTLTDHRIEVGMGGAIHNLGDLLLLRCRVSSNSATGGRGGPGGFGGDGGGGGGLGGGLFSLGGRVVISNSVFEANVATGGAGGRRENNDPYLGGSGGGPQGGAGGPGNANGGNGGLGSGGGGGGHSTGIGGNGGIGGGGGGGGASLPPMPLPGESEFGGGRGGYASLAAGSGNGGGGGGGAGLGAAIFVMDGILRAVESRWEGNRSEGGQGGGVYAGGQGGGAYGAAVFVQGGSAELRNSLLSRNQAEGGSGGGGHHGALGGHAGGGAVFFRQANAALIGCTVVSNLARSGPTASGSRSSREGSGAWGGGLGLYEGYTHLTNCTVSANTIQGGLGGTVDVGEDGGPAWGGGFGAISNAVTLVHCTITLNTALGGDAGFSWPGNPRGAPGESLGGGFYQTNGVVRLLNTLVAGNTRTAAGTRSDGYGPIDSLGPNLFGTQDGLYGLGPFDRVGLDPQLGPLAMLGGPTPVHPLPPGSAALDSGSVEGAPGTDQRGIIRPAGSGVDLGSFELVRSNSPRAWILIDGQPVPGGSVRAVGTAAVAMESSLPGEPLRYTLDGTEPSATSPPYDGPFAVIASSTIRAAVFPAGGGPGVVAPTVNVLVIPPGSYRLNLTTTGQGRLRVDPPEGPYPAGTVVRITALPDPYWAFAGWTGDADEPFRHTELVMASDRTLHAIFAPFPAYPLKLVLDGLGQVEVEPAGGTYLSNTVVRLVAREVQNRDTTGYSSFAGWSGDLGGSSPTNQIAINGPRTVTAHFPRTDWDPPRYWVDVSTPGGGIVSVDPAPAPGAYPSNSLVTLRLFRPEERWEFMHWMGDVEGTNPVHTFRIRQNTRAIAVFGTRPTYTALKTDPVGSPLEYLPTLPRILQPEYTLFPYGAKIRLTVLPPPGTMMAGWLGEYDGDWGDPHVEFESFSLGPMLGATLRPVPANRVAFTSTAMGRGRVISSVRSGNHPVGGSATLTAQPDLGQAFLGWTGDATGTDPTLTVPLDVSRTIIGTFTERPTLSWVDVYGDGLPDRFRLQLDAAPETRWILEASTDLRAWRPVGTNDTPTGLHVLGIHAGPVGSPRFYRATSAPR